ncbi:MAG: hypothetical protein JKY45_08895, partial [Emcibacter sp.]|nr:hypothetical protein [Emcibacter sp.]
MTNPLRTKISIDPLKVIGTHTNFPLAENRAVFSGAADVMFDPADPNRSAGGDQRRFDKDGTTELSRDFVAFGLDSVAGAGDGEFEGWV